MIILHDCLLVTLMVYLALPPGNGVYANNAALRLWFSVYTIPSPSVLACIILVREVSVPLTPSTVVHPSTYSSPWKLVDSFLQAENTHNNKRNEPIISFSII